MKLRLVQDQPSTANSFEQDFENWLEDLRGIVWNDFIKGRRSLENLAADAKLSLSTVQKFAWGETKKPHLQTVFKLMKALGYRLPVIPLTAPRQKDEVDYATLRSALPPRKK